ncbi:MAG: 1-deoxy-D-xylulose-5-phosphate synthase [Candidatus Krumholzibacteria bacterium]|nr:1-deoxy-D-xylulose-5-phosphate synthase [Candidatus Krumholzibacteria bacterium]MDH4336454.1 1-deoxy-D-xylulose-5-phosphate synthase [Candidatus Krumholzibacteria bacterium]MDH5269046.1 1-deoxy-D-xylulose-5-phosphate synthase [Candidatus Krumholzibacteria bacterium]
MSILDRIHYPSDLKSVPVQDLPQLARELRDEILTSVGRTGGHLGASLGAVELTLALHYVFDAPRDQIVWDVGHQAYGHKIITGRREQFDTLRQRHGLSGFPRRDESEYDTFGVAHASTAISAALGMAIARDIKGEAFNVLAVVGDGALTGGMAFEAMNNAGVLKKDMVVVLNDNRMSISHNVGALHKYLTKITSGALYNHLQADVWELLGHLPRGGGKARRVARKIKESIKTLVVPGVIFEELGFRYFGPIDGHNVEFLVQTFEHIRNLNGPILVHVITQKGKGYHFTENDPFCAHGVTRYDKIPGDRPAKKGNPSYTGVYGKTILEMARADKRIVAITAAMPDNTGLTDFAREIPDRVFDVGIAEQHGVTFAAGLATRGIVPMVTIYSTFLQRAFDQVIHDVALQSLPVRFILDRGGIVGEDGPTHHGTFDLSYLRMVPNFVIMAPKDENELRHMVKTAVSYEAGPIAIRFPRGEGLGVPMDEALQEIPIGRAEVLSTGRDVMFVAIGAMVAPCVAAAVALGSRGINAGVVNARFVKPLDSELLDQLAAGDALIITVEDNVLAGGFGSAVNEYWVEHHHDLVNVRNLGLPDRFIEHGDRDGLLAEAGLSAEAIAQFAADAHDERRRSVRSVAS